MLPASHGAFVQGYCAANRTAPGSGRALIFWQNGEVV
jgi:hypothetical protein